MRIGVHVGHWEGTPHDVAALAVEAERAGMDSVWISETWGSDGVVLLAWIAAHTERIGLGRACCRCRRVRRCRRRWPPSHSTI